MKSAKAQKPRIVSATVVGVRTAKRGKPPRLEFRSVRDIGVKRRRKGSS